MGTKVVHIYEKAFLGNKLQEVNIPKSIKNKTKGVDGIKQLILFLKIRNINRRILLIIQIMK